MSGFLNSVEENSTGSALHERRPVPPMISLKLELVTDQKLRILMFVKVVIMNQRFVVTGGSSINNMKDKKKYFKDNAFFQGQPVKTFQNGGDVTALAG